LQEGLYKVEFHTVHGTGTGVVYAHSGKLRGGNSAFAFIGSYRDAGNGINAKVSTERHNDDPAFRPLFGTDMITLTLKGTENGDMVDLEGTALQLPGVAFKAILTRICD
jgi:T3SS negative regulator,GrlR